MHACTHLLEACHLFSLLSAAQRKSCRGKRWMGRRRWCFYFWAFLRVSGTVATLPYQREPSPDEKRAKDFIYFLTQPNTEMWLPSCSCEGVSIKIPFGPSYSFMFLQECVIFALSDKSPCVSGMSVASNIARVVCNLIYSRRPRAPKAPNSTSPCAEREFIIKMELFHMIRFKEKV